ncbi:MAG: repressor LexA [Planctomycetes bacterium]|nr:repressor LexA [Planctomycetota bacterium]
MNYTPKQLQIMKFIQDYRRANGTSPTLEEIGKTLGIHRVTVHQHVGALVKKGAVQKLAQRSRSIEILDREFLPAPTIPLLGRIAAGRPIEAIEEADPLTIEELLPVTPGNSYLLRVSGQSMIEDHIADGDLVVIEPRNAARDGEIVVAVVDGDATLKRLYRDGPDAWRLQPANASMAPIFVRPPQKLEIRGVVRGVIRRY